MTDNPLEGTGEKYSIRTFSGDGSQTVWEFSFDGGYISRTHVKIFVTAEDGTITIPSFTWIGDSTINVTPAVTDGAILTIYRDTPKNAPLVDYTDGAILSEINLDRQSEQGVFAAAEMVDRFSISLGYSTEALDLAQSASDLAQQAYDQAQAQLDGSGLASVSLGNVNPVTGRTSLGFGGNSQLLSWGNLYINPWDGVSDQFAVGQTQSTYLPNGSLGAIYGQRIASYSGGEPSYATATVSSAIRGYTQVASSAGIAVEVGSMGTVDNNSFISQGVGAVGTTFTKNGGAGWGGVFENVEEARTYVATAAQTEFAVEGGYTSNQVVVTRLRAGVTTVLTQTTDYIATSGTVITLTAPALVNDLIRIYPFNPLKGQVGTEIDTTVGYGPDTVNVHAGNRQGLAIVGRRRNMDANIVSHAGVLLNLYASPDDPTYFIADRGVNFEGQFDRGIDFSSTNASFASWLIKFPGGVSGVSPGGNLSVGNLGTFDLAGYGTLLVGKTTNGGLVRTGDGTHFSRMSCSTAGGAVFGSDTNIDLVFNRNGAERARIVNTGFASTTMVSHNYANDAAAAAGGVPVGGLYHNAGAVRVRLT